MTTRSGPARLRLEVCDHRASVAGGQAIPGTGHTTHHVRRAAPWAVHQKQNSPAPQGPRGSNQGAGPIGHRGRASVRSGRAEQGPGQDAPGERGQAGAVQRATARAGWGPRSPQAAARAREKRAARRGNPRSRLKTGRGPYPPHCRSPAAASCPRRSPGASGSDNHRNDFSLGAFWAPVE